MYHCYFLINYIGPPKVFSFPLAPSLKSLPITDLDNPHMMVARFPALRTGRLYPQGNIPGIHFCYRQSLTPSHSEAGRIMSIKNDMEIENYENELRSNGWRGHGRKNRVQTCSVMHSKLREHFH